METLAARLAYGHHLWFGSEAIGGRLAEIAGDLGIGVNLACTV